ncbi:MAG: hypothetical protein HC868_09955 [Sphingomonadales bacterium]|nr:hypothetical protein [Sphingomonadales bacterium]
MHAPSNPSDLADLLPRRSIAVRAPSAVNGEAIGVIVLLLVLLGGVLAWLGPGIATDWRMRHDAVAADDVRVRQAHCRSWLAVLQICNVALAADNGDAAGSEHTEWYVFLGRRADPSAAPLRSRSDASRVTTDLGLYKVRRRLVTLLLLAGILVCCIGVAAAMMWRSLQARRTFAGMSGQRLTPVLVEIERNNRLPPRRRLWVYLYDDGGKRERALAEWPSKQQPLFTTPDERWALALRGDKGGTPMLLDVGLKALDLTQAERAAFREAFLAKFGDRTPVAASI